jgi:3-deoxy-manno-octulosonate cytidylyltransferase (CMP-KDO synthetase)
MGESVLKDRTQSQLKEAMNARTEVMAAVVVPARLDSTRFPGKALRDKTGRPLFAHTLDVALKAQHATDVGLVTDSRRIEEASREMFTGKVMALFSPTSASCGSQRVGHWLDYFDGEDTWDVVVNLQCDEPCVDPRDLDNLIMGCAMSEQISTLVAPFPSTQAGRARRSEPGNVKAWRRGDRIHDFTREYPCPRASGSAWHHLGVYAFPRKLFRRMRDEPNDRARQNSLEQLTWLDMGEKLFAVEAKHTSQILSVNTPADYEKFCRWFQSRCEAK